MTKKTRSKKSNEYLIEYSEQDKMVYVNLLTDDDFWVELYNKKAIGRAVDLAELEGYALKLDNHVVELVCIDG